VEVGATMLGSIRRSHVLLAVMLAVACVLGSFADADARRRPRRNPRPPVAGRFDYYVLSLSWSPEHCASPAGDGDHRQCGSTRRYAFIVHGLWPQFAKGFPESCGTTPLPVAVRDRMLDIMPSERLVRHEWRKHGTCSGLGPEEYFAKARAAFASITIPAAFHEPPHAIRTDVAAIEREFGTVNPALTPEAIAVQCTKQYLQEIRVCFDRELRPRACGVDVDDRCTGAVIVRPIR
jgi:ribonuclease T2